MRVPTKDGVSVGLNSSAQISTAMTSMATDLASSAMGLVQKYQSEKDSSDLQEAQNKRIKAVNDWKGEAFQKEGEAALGLTKSYIDKSKEIDDGITANLSPRARKEYDNWSFRTGENDRMSVMLHEQKSDQQVKTARFNNGLTLSEDMVRKDARSYQDAAFHLESTLQNGLSSGIIKPEEFESKKIEIENKFRGEVGKSYYTQNKHEFMKKINDFGFGESEKARWNEKYKDDLAAEAREKKTLYAEEARLIMDQRKDFSAQAVDKSDTSHYFENAKKLNDMGYKDWARDLEREGKLYDRTIKFNDQYKGAPLSEKFKAAKDLQVSNEVAGSGIDFQSRQTIQKETFKQVQAFNKDPAEFVSKIAQGSNFEEIGSSRISLQKSQGIVPEKGFNILTGAENSNYKQAFEAGDERQKAELVMELGKYGKHAPKVIQELGVSKSLAFAPMFKNKRDIELLVSGATSKPTNLDSNIKTSDYEEAAQDSKLFQMMAKVQTDFPTDSGLGEHLKDLKNTMVNISMKKMDPNAGSKFFDDNFEVEEDSDKKIYFSKEYDSDDVIKTLDTKKQQILDSFKTNNKQYDTQAKWAIRDYSWVNSPSGFVLADKKTGRIVPGSSVEYTEVKNGLAPHKSRKELIAGE